MEIRIYWFFQSPKRTTLKWDTVYTELCRSCEVNECMRTYKESYNLRGQCLRLDGGLFKSVSVCEYENMWVWGTVMLGARWNGPHTIAFRAFCVSAKPRGASSLPVRKLWQNRAVYARLAATFNGFVLYFYRRRADIHIRFRVYFLLTRTTPFRKHRYMQIPTK